MSTTGETEKEKKSEENKPKSVKTASHPPYFEMIKEAVLALKEKGGSSPHAIAKYMEEKHKAVLPANFRKILGLQLKNSTSKGKLIKIKASYKLSASAPKLNNKKVNMAKAKANNKVKAVKKTRAARATASSTTTTIAAKPRGKAVKKRAAPVKAKAKQPKSIKSPAAAAKKAAA